MAFDAGMLACMVHEIRTVALGGRIEKVMQPERDEIILQLRQGEDMLGIIHKIFEKYLSLRNAQE